MNPLPRRSALTGIALTAAAAAPAKATSQDGELIAHRATVAIGVKKLAGARGCYTHLPSFMPLGWCEGLPPFP